MSLCSCYYVPTVLYCYDVMLTPEILTYIKDSTQGNFLVYLTFPLSCYVVSVNQALWVRKLKQHLKQNFMTVLLP